MSQLNGESPEWPGEMNEQNRIYWRPQFFITLSPATKTKNKVQKNSVCMDLKMMHIRLCRHIPSNPGSFALYNTSAWRHKKTRWNIIACRMTKPFQSLGIVNGWFVSGDHCPQTFFHQVSNQELPTQHVLRIHVRSATTKTYKRLETLVCYLWIGRCFLF